VKSIDTGRYRGLFVTVQARLVVADPSRGDERSRAQLGLQVGADYYLETGTDYSGLRRTSASAGRRRVTNDWQAFSYTTLSDVGIRCRGGGITEAEFRSAPPPLE
jgi:hypothetical protein